MSKRIMVFDLSAAEVRVMICGCENGLLSLEPVHSFDNYSISEMGHIRWNVDELFTQLKIGMSLGVFNGGYDAVSIDGWGGDFGLLDANGELLEMPVHYRDSRTNGIMKELYAVVSEEELFERTGILPRKTGTVFQLLAQLKQEGSTIFRAESLLLIPDLFAYLLTGERRSELTSAAATLLIDRVTRSWDYPLIDKLGLPRRIFCPIVGAGERIGFLKPEIASDLRIEPIPVYACASHDAASALAAVPSQEEEFIFVNCGNRAVIGAELSKPIVTEQVRAAGFSNMTGYANTAFLRKDVMGLQLIREAQRYYNEVCGNQYTLADLENAARESESFISFINPNDPLFAKHGELPPKIAEYCRRTNQPVPETAGEVMRCIYLSLACSFALGAECLEELTGRKFSTLYMVGECTQSALLCELTAQASDRKIVAGASEAAALGNGISSLIAMGELNDIAQARQAIVASGMTRSYEPQSPELRTLHMNHFKALIGQ